MENLVGEVANFRFAVARQQNDFVHFVARPEVGDELPALLPGGIAEAKRGSVPAIHEEKALETRNRGRQRQSLG